MSSKIIALATGIVVAATLAAPTAEAGMRIHFGFPIGAFNAGGGHGHYRSHHHDDYRALRRAKAAEAARIRRERAAAARARKERAAALAAAKRERAAAVAAAKAAERRKAAAAAAEDKKSADAVVAKNTISAERVGQRAPDGKSNAAAPLKTAANTATADTTTSGATTSDEAPAKLECKRYFANVGMTISVPCTQ